MFRTTLTGLVEDVFDVERNRWLVPQAAGRCLRCTATADASIKLTGTRCLLGNVRTTHGTPSLSQHSTASVHPIGAGRQARKTAFDLLSATGGCSIKCTVPDIALNVTDNRSSNHPASVLRRRGGRSPYDDRRRIGEGPGAPHRELGILLRAAFVSRVPRQQSVRETPSTDRLDLRKPGWNMGLHAPPGTIGCAPLLSHSGIDAAPQSADGCLRRLPAPGSYSAGCKGRSCSPSGLLFGFPNSSVCFLILSIAIACSL